MANKIEFSIIAADRFSKQFASFRTGLDKTIKRAAVFGAVFAAGAVVASKALIKVASENETLRIRMNAMLGSVAEGNRLFEDMAKFAGEVPFAYDKIMSSATQLSGIMRGGVDEINQWMPMIADIAAVSGLSIEKTTEQVVRLYSAGAGAADLFRERGINAMLGFEAGVAISAENSRKKLIEAFTTADSKIRGAAQNLATTWIGIMSMIGDKWREIQVQISEGGLFNFFKALAIEIDRTMGEALDVTRENGRIWSESLINDIRAIMDAFGFLADMFRGIAVVWKGLELIFAGFTVVIVGALAGIVKLVSSIINGVIVASNRFAGTTIPLMGNLDDVVTAVVQTTKDLATEMDELALKRMPSDELNEYRARVEETFEVLQLASENQANAAIDAQKKITAETLQEMDTRVGKLIESNQTSIDLLTEWSTEYTDIFSATMLGVFNQAETLGTEVSSIITQTYETLTKGIGDAVAQAIVSGADLGKAMKALLKQVVANIIASFVTMGIQRAIMSSIFGAASAREASSALAGGFAQTYTNAFASTAAIPIIGPALAPGVAAASLIAVQAGSAAAMTLGGGQGLLVPQAHGGLTNNPEESTFLIKRGERVLSPPQNTDLTNFLNEGGGSGVTIENFNVDINVDDIRDITTEDMEELVAGKIIPALDKLDKDGIRQAAIERSNV